MCFVSDRFWCFPGIGVTLHSLLSTAPYSFPGILPASGFQWTLFHFGESYGLQWTSSRKSLRRFQSTGDRIMFICQIWETSTGSLWLLGMDRPHGIMLLAYLYPEKYWPRSGMQRENPGFTGYGMLWKKTRGMSQFLGTNLLPLAC